MAIIERPTYLDKLAKARHNGRVKVITGIRRCGKSFLLSSIYRRFLLNEGVPNEHILSIALDRRENEDLRDPTRLYEYVTERVDETNQYYIFIDEIQLSYKVKRADVDEAAVAPEDRDLLYTTFYDVLNDLMSRENLDVYVTGSNSKMLSSDIVTNFRDRGTEIRMWPLSFAEYFAFVGGEKPDAWANYIVYGGMPTAVLEPDDRERETYLKRLFDTVYRADIVERYSITNDYLLEQLAKEVASAVGSLTNPSKLANSLNTIRQAKKDDKTNDKTVTKYLNALIDAFVFSKAERYDVKGKRYFEYPAKYYATDVGLRNALLNFRQVEETHLMENVVFNELCLRGYSVDVGAVRIVKTVDGERHDDLHEIDFVVNKGSQKAYIQCALNVESPAKRAQETEPLLKSGDFFQKYVITGGSQQPWTDEDGITYMGIIPFLLDFHALE